VNKFEGDAALCVFGAPSGQVDHATRCLRTARALRGALQQLSREREGLDAGIGVASGLVVAGNVGAEDRYEYTVIGDAVNEAARLAELAKQNPCRVLASEDSVVRAGHGDGGWVQSEEVLLRGRDRVTQTYSLAVR
jgi:adenylate cyclase